MSWTCRISTAFLTIIVVSLLLPTTASAFCGFYVSGANADLYNNATMVSLMREGKRTVLSMQNNYEGPPKDFAMVVPVPVVLEKKQVKTLPDDVFARLDQLTAPRLVEYWERDPCEVRKKKGSLLLDLGSSGRGSAGMQFSVPAKAKVKVHAQFKVGEYDIAILSSTESTALEKWLKQNKYNIPKGAAPYFKPYIQNGQYFFVAKVDVKKVKFEDGEAVLSPIRFHYDSDDFVLPVRLGLINSKGVQDLIAFVLAKGQRYEVANYPNVTIPTNVVVNEKAKKNFGGFYNELFDNVLKENPKAVVTEYSWRTSTCDPCPGPPLRNKDLMTLGADVLTAAMLDKAAEQREEARKKSGSVAPAPRRRVVHQNWVVTRLHARYNKHTLGKDLVFKKAKPIVGGRGMPQGAEGTFSEKGSKQANVNNFQGRYIKLNHWAGDVDCENPRRGIWGGPGGRGKAKADAAKDLAFDAPKSKLALSKYVEEKKVAGLKKDVAKYNKPVGDVLPSTGAESPEKDDPEKTKPAKPKRDKNDDESSMLPASGEDSARAQTAASGGCAGPGGASEAGMPLIVLLLALGGLGRVLWGREL
ncbi:DUF2330 domain-containing protein [Persicimonas caeni]|uniref:DUF2330 domain-containing protein n=1 Tax=Persicimonas caeni TaxID=2292766 RepID=A0A4Y6PUS7_PERCE|nr:DUF2330 domain-containing protein [Persicimonas caeni]QDG52003.1 DUF2330 domain-containing protein [Persicimonas caeni]QED33224.1 DUF2330 domain-containing protein [Persicimonas caeni]